MSSCPECGYVSSEHGVKSHIGRMHKDRHSYECENCGKEEEIRPGLDKSFCSMLCKKVAESDSDNLHEFARNKWSKCVYCGDWHVNRNDGRFCSTECQGSWREGREIGGGPSRTKYNCPECADSFESYSKDRTFCSFSCRSSYYGRRREIDLDVNPLYQIRIPEDVRDSAYERDNQMCQDCGFSQEDHVDMFNQRLDIHHKTPRVSFLREESSIEEAKQKANELDNLVTLCKSCHSKREYEDHPDFKQTGV